MDQYAQPAAEITWSSKDQPAPAKVRLNWTLFAAICLCAATWAGVLWAGSAALN